MLHNKKKYFRNLEVTSHARQMHVQSINQEVKQITCLRLSFELSSFIIFHGLYFHHSSSPLSAPVGCEARGVSLMMGFLLQNQSHISDSAVQNRMTRLNVSDVLTHVTAVLDFLA